MNLDEYLQSLENSTSDDDLLSKLRFYDNWDILLRADFDCVVSDLKNSGNYKESAIVSEDDQGDRYRNYLFYFVPGTVLLQVCNRVYGPSPRLSSEDQEKQKQYNITISLHPYQGNRSYKNGKKMEGRTDNEAMAMAIRNLGNYARVMQVPICFVRPNIYFEPNQKSDKQ